MNWPLRESLSQMPHFTILTFLRLMKGSLDYLSGSLLLYVQLHWIHCKGETVAIARYGDFFLEMKN